MFQRPWTNDLYKPLAACRPRPMGNKAGRYLLLYPVNREGFTDHRHKENVAVVRIKVCYHLDATRDW